MENHIRFPTPFNCVNHSMTTTTTTKRRYLDREADFPYKINHEDLCFKLFTEHGFEWGGDWEDRKDYQHFAIPTTLIEEWYPSNK